MIESKSVSINEYYSLNFLETIKDPKLLLQKIKKQKAAIGELIEKGETEKAEEIKKGLAWKKAFDKTEGKKVWSACIPLIWRTIWFKCFPFCL